MNPLSMKTSIVVTALILAGFATLGWQKQTAIGRLREEERALISNAKGAGVVSISEPPERSVKKPRVDREKEANETAAKLIATLKEAAILRPGEPNEQVEARIKAFNDSIYQLSGYQLRVLIAQLRDTLDFRHRQSVIDSGIMALAETDPAAAIRILTEVRSELDPSYQPSELQSHLIGKWAATDPLAAIEWTRNHTEFRKFAGYRETKELILGVAANDPRMAFRLIEEFKTPSANEDGFSVEGVPDLEVDMALQIARTARSLEERTIMLALVREMAKNPAISEHAVRVATTVMVEGLATYGHEKATAWLASAKLQPNEAAWLRESLVNQFPRAPDDATARLIEWFPVPSLNK